jgi:hypothetical protein
VQAQAPTVIIFSLGSSDLPLLHLSTDQRSAS